MSTPEVNERLADPGEERNILACVYQSLDAWLRVSDQVTAEDFTSPVTKTLWSLLDDMRENGITPSPVVVHDKLPPDIKSIVDEMGAWGFINTLAEIPVDPSNVEHHAKKLRELTVLRRGERAGETIKEAANTAKNAQEFLDKVDEIVNEIPGEVGQDVIRLGSIALEYVEERAAHPKEIPGISTGFKELDSIIQGFQNQRMYIIAARTGFGKSIFHLNCVANLALNQDYKVLYVSTEQSPKDEISRLISMVAEVPEHVLNKGSFIDVPNWAERIQDAVESIEKAPIFFSYDPLFTPHKLYRTIKKYVKVEKVDAVFFDYIRIPAENVASRDKWAIVGDLAYGLKAVAGDLDVPVITAVQVNRDGAEQFRLTGDMDSGVFAGSDEIERAASVAMILRGLNKKEREEYEFGTGQKRMLTFSKNRHGKKSDKILFALGDEYVKLEERQRVLPE